MKRTPEGAAPDTKNKDFNVTAYVTIPSSDPTVNGVLATMGGRFGGYALYLRDGHLVYHYNYVGKYAAEASLVSLMMPRMQLC